MRLRHAVSILATTSVLVLGCARQDKDPVLATVGDSRITLATYRDAYNALTGEKPDIADPEKRRAFLQDLINKQLLENEARRLAPELDDGQRRRLHRFAETSLLQSLADREVRKKISVTDDEIKAVWNRMDKEYRARHILARNDGELQKIQSELQAGRSFEDVARELSFDTGSGEKGGELGWISAGQMVKPFDEALWKMSPGEVSEPVQTQFGLHIIKVEEVRPAEKPTLESVKDRVYNSLFQQQSRVLTENLHKSIMDEASPENQLEAVALIDRKFTFDVPLDQANDPYAELNTPRDLPTFSEEELQMTVVKFADRPDFTVRDFNEALGWMPPGVWPKGRGSEEVEDLIRQMMRTKLYRERAIKLGIDKSQEFVSMVKKKENEMRVNYLYYNGIAAQVQPGDSDLRDYFEKNRDNFKILERSIQARVETADSVVAALAADRWRGGRSFEEVEALVKREDPGALTISNTMEIPRGAEPPLDDLLYSAKPKDVVGPVYLSGIRDANGTEMPARWVVAQVIDLRPERFMTFEEAQTYVQEGAKAEMADVRLKELLAECEKRWPVTVNDKALADIKPETITNGGSTT